MTGIFGGSFDPPHVAHLIVAETVRDQFGLDQVIWIPARHAPHKQDRSHAEAGHRLSMVRLAVAGNPHFSVSEMELRREGVSYTADTVRQLQEDHPGEAFALILGGDSVTSFHTWHEPQEILDRVPLLVYGRGDEEPARLNPSLQGRIQHVQAPLLGVSSSQIRLRRRRGQTIRYLVPDAVLEHIEANKLYL